LIDLCRRKFRLSDLERLVFAIAVVVLDLAETRETDDVPICLVVEDEASAPLPIPDPDVDPAVPGRLFGCIYNCQTGALTAPPEPPSCSPSDPMPPAKNVSSDLRLLLLVLPTLPLVPSEPKADGGPPFFPTRNRHTPFPAPAAATAELLSVSTSELPAAASVEAVAFAFDLGFHVPGECE